MITRSMIPLAIICFFLASCEQEYMLQPEAVTIEEQTVEPVIEMSFTETVVVSSSTDNSPAGMSLRKDGRSASRLRDYSKTRCTIKVDSNGGVFSEVVYLDGNSDVRIPMRLYERIKANMHPIDPHRKPIVRYTIHNRLYTGYAADGSIVKRRLFPQEPRLGDMKIEDYTKRRIDIARLGDSSRSVAYAQTLEQRGIPYSLVGHRELIYDTRLAGSTKGGIVRTRADAVTGVVNQTLQFDEGNRLERASKLYHRSIEGIPMKISEITDVFSTSGRGIGRLTHTIKRMRTVISVKVKKNVQQGAAKEPEPLSKGGGK